MSDTFAQLLDRAIQAREALFAPQHQTACRLFYGFLEGEPRLVIDLYATTVVLHDYADPAVGDPALLTTAQQVIRARLPWVRAFLLKSRRAASPAAQCGQIIAGETLDRRIREHNVWYALDLTVNRDTSFYLDLRNLRQWALTNLQDKTVLNTFAYTGSLGVAAQASGAARVVHLDRNRRFLNVAKTSYTLNGLPIHKPDFHVGDFWAYTSQLRRQGHTFDCVFLDPPFFATTPGGVVDLERHASRLINKVRPLINDGGWLVAVNNTLFLSGAAYMQSLIALGADGYMELAEIIPVPADVIGYAHTRCGAPITDPAPFNHATKIAILRIRRKSVST